jgi:glutamate carboxypeptidase
MLITPDEEIGSPGSAHLLEEAARRNHFGLIFEPAFTDGTLAGNRKGSGSFTAIVRGRAAHGGREPQLGRNAIVALAGFIQAINALNGQQPGITVNPGKIEGGGPVNIVPDLAICRLNVRVATVQEQDWVQQQLRRICEQIQHQEGISIHLHGGFGRPPKILSPENLQLLQLLAACGDELGVPVRWQDSGGVCDGNNLAAAGLANIDSLGVRGGGLHSGDEFVLIDSLTERARLSALLLMKLGAGELTWPAMAGGVS